MTPRLILAAGRSATNLVLELGRVAVFGGLVLRSIRWLPFRTRRLIDELYQIGVLSLAIICVAGLTVGMVLGLQGYNTLSRFGAAESLGAMVGLILIRELGPVMTGLLVTGRAGSAIAAELSAMVVTEQLDGLRMMSIDPIDIVISPKAIAMILCMPLLGALFTVIGIFGAYLVGVILLGLDGGVYLSSLEGAVRLETDVLANLVKTFAFGVLVALIATYRGYSADPHSASVSRATTSTVVIGSLAILICDYLITALWGV